MEDPEHFPDIGNASTSQTNKTSQRFVFTLNNYTDEEVGRIGDPPEFIQYVGYSKEVGASGTPHLQGWVYTWQPVRMSQIKKQFLRRAHIEIMYSSFDKNDKYCSKESTMTHIGTRPQQGRRTDILGVKRRLDEGESFRSVMEDEATFAICMKNERALRGYSETARYKKMRKEGRKVPKVYIRIGPTRTGKSSYVYDTHGYDNVFLCPDNTCRWFDGYSGEPVILFDDVEAGKVPPVEFLKRLADGYPGFKAPVKGGFTYIRPEYIYFTSNHLTREWWPDIKQCDWQAIKERITEVVAVYKDRPDVVLFTKDAPNQEDAPDPPADPQVPGEEQDSAQGEAND